MQPHAFLSLTCYEVVMVEMVCLEEMERKENKENRDHLDLKERKDLQDLGVLESPTLGGERAPVQTLLELN